MVKRIGYGASSVIHIGLALFALSLVFGGGGGGGSTDGGGAQGATAWLMSKPFGLWLVGIAGAIGIGTGIYQIIKGVKAKFRRKLRLHEMSETEETWATRLGRIGFIARGIVFSMIGWFLIRAAWQADPQESGGLGKALHTLAEQPYGPWLLGIVAAGLMAYGIFCFAMARYRYLHVE